MNKAEELKSYLPRYYDESPQMNAICDSSGVEFEDLYSNVFDLTNQCFPQTATWGIKYWETFLGIPESSAEDLSTRRAKIISKLSRTSPITPYEMRRILGNFVDNAVLTQFPEEYRFEISLQTKTKLEKVLDAIIREVEEIKPAHLDFSISINYLTELQISELFGRWLSSPFYVCGTINVNYKPYTSTQGLVFKQALSTTVSHYYTDKMIVTSENTYIDGIGVSDINMLHFSSSVNSTLQPVTAASENNHAKGGG